MTVSAQRRFDLNQPLGITLLAFVGAVIWVLFPGPRNLALLSIVIFLIIGFNRPVWAIAALLISQFTIPSFMIGPLSLRLLLVIVIGFIILRVHIKKKTSLGKKAKYLIIPLLVFTFIALMSNFINTNFDNVFKYFRYAIGGLLIVIYIPAVVTDVKELKKLCAVAIIVATISVIVALMQGAAHSFSDRVQGISESQLQLSYIICVCFLSLFGILIINGIKKGNRRFLIPLLFMVPALYLTYTRSAIIGVFVGLIALFAFFKTRIKAEIILLFVLGFSLFLSISGLTESASISGRDQEQQAGSSRSRKVFWDAGLAIVKDYPIFGIGTGQFERISMLYVDDIDPSLFKLSDGRYTTPEAVGLGTTSIHNDFLSVWVSFGFVALILFLWIHLAVLRNFVDSYHYSKNKFIRGLSLGLAAALISYVVNAFYHNQMNEFSLFFIIAGFSLAIAKITSLEKAPRKITGNSVIENA